MPRPRPYHVVRLGSWRWELSHAFPTPAPPPWLGAPETLRDEAETVVRTESDLVLPRVFAVRRPEWPGVLLLVKRVPARTGLRAIRDWFRRSPSVRAFRRAFVMEELGLHTPQVVAAGEQRRWGRLQESWFVSVFATGTETLRAFALRETRRQPRLTLVRSIAHTLARLHAAGWLYRDAHATNFLVRPGRPVRDATVLLDLEALCYRAWVPPWLAARELRRTWLRLRLPLTPRERLWFVAEYARHRPGPRSARRWLAAFAERSIGPQPENQGLAPTSPA